MAIEIHIRVKESDWENESEIANLLAEQINGLIVEEMNIPVLVVPVEDPANEMEPLLKLK